MAAKQLFSVFQIEFSIENAWATTKKHTQRICSLIQSFDELSELLAEPHSRNKQLRFNYISVSF